MVAVSPNCSGLIMVGRLPVVIGQLGRVPIADSSSVDELARGELERAVRDLLNAFGISLFPNFITQDFSVLKRGDGLGSFAIEVTGRGHC